MSEDFDLLDVVPEDEELKEFDFVSEEEKKLLDLRKEAKTEYTKAKKEYTKKKNRLRKLVNIKTNQEKFAEIQQSLENVQHLVQDMRYSAIFDDEFIDFICFTIGFVVGLVIVIYMMGIISQNILKRVNMNVAHLKKDALNRKCDEAIKKFDVGCGYVF